MQNSALGDIPMQVFTQTGHSCLKSIGLTTTTVVNWITSNAEVRSQRAATVIEDGDLSVGVVQIASRFVRGIVSYVKEEQQVEIGQRIGMIRFGSQVDLAIPDVVDCQIAVKPGQVVKAGFTVLARYGQANAS